jgi:hypothetical protein
MKSFIAINLFGMIVTCEELSKVELNHELIHTAQARELLYIPFYLWYIYRMVFLISQISGLDAGILQHQV